MSLLVPFGKEEGGRRRITKQIKKKKRKRNRKKMRKRKYIYIYLFSDCRDAEKLIERHVAAQGLSERPDERPMRSQMSPRDPEL